MISLQQYLRDPCGTASIPYWKEKQIVVPENMRIIHERDYRSEEYCDYSDEPYFRLYHDLVTVDPLTTSELEIVSGASDLDGFVSLINSCYDDLSVTKEQLEGYQKTPVYRSELWVILKEKSSGIVVAGGIADYDREIGELILEWIQVLPSWRGRGYGQIIVNCLLTRMLGIAKFATVSGKVNNPTNPQSLYRRCGFTGKDIWHILTKK